MGENEQGGMLRTIVVLGLIALIALIVVSGVVIAKNHMTTTTLNTVSLIDKQTDKSSPEDAVPKAAWQSLTNESVDMSTGKHIAVRADFNFKDSSVAAGSQGLVTRIDVSSKDSFLGVDYNTGKMTAFKFDHFTLTDGDGKVVTSLNASAHDGFVADSNMSGLSSYLTDVGKTALDKVTDAQSFKAFVGNADNFTDGVIGTDIYQGDLDNIWRKFGTQWFDGRHFKAGQTYHLYADSVIDKAHADHNLLTDGDVTPELNLDDIAVDGTIGVMLSSAMGHLFGVPYFEMHGPTSVGEADGVFLPDLMSNAEYAVY